MKEFPNLKKPNEGLIYLGNDLNDLSMMRYAGFSVAPIDSHEIIKKEADLVIEKKGGDSFIRTFIEDLIQLESMDLDYIEKLLKLKDNKFLKESNENYKTKHKLI